MTDVFSYHLTGTDPLENLCLEEILFESFAHEREIRLTYVNSPCVVIGKHQNPWRETRPEALKAEGIPLLRRISGGGTVWHDGGNLVFSWMGPRKLYSRARIDAWLGAALESLGLKFDISSMGDYLYKGFKFSGNAFAFRQDRVLHHGTLLIDTNLERLNDYMGGLDFPRSIGIASRPQPVINLAAVDANISVPVVLSALKTVSKGLPGTFYYGKALEDLMYQRASDGWVLGATPVFSINRADGSELEVKDGKINGEYFRIKEEKR